MKLLFQIFVLIVTLLLSLGGFLTMIDKSEDNVTRGLHGFIFLLSSYLFILVLTYSI